MGHRVLLLGANGQVGTELGRIFAGLGLTALDRSSADLSKPESLRAIVRAAKFDVILNAAAYTAVDKAETEPALADLVNHQSVRVLAEEAQRIGALLVHYSTDYVFDGSKRDAWIESDTPAPLNVYGETKLAGERAIQSVCERHLVLRTSWVYGAHGHNFLRTMLRLGRERDVLRVIDDQWGAPTSASALAEITDKLIGSVTGEQMNGALPWAGVYHTTCDGSTTWRRFAQAIFEKAFATRIIERIPEVQGIRTEDYPTAATRPQNSLLSNQKLQERFGFGLPTWESAFNAVWNEMQQNVPA